MTTVRLTDEMVPFGLNVEGARRWYSIDERDWRPMKIGDTVLPGFSWIPVADDEGGAWSSYWMRLQPGARSFEHRHDSTELIMVLDGVLPTKTAPTSCQETPCATRPARGIARRRRQAARCWWSLRPARRSCQAYRIENWRRVARRQQESNDAR